MLPSYLMTLVSDPLLQTARGKLQTRRSKLNDEINKELRLRAGAENLFRATQNKRLKQLVAVELSFFNSNIQLLKEELSELNSSVNIYQHDNCIDCVPMIPLGLKETREVDSSVAIKDFILKHYSEDGNNYENAINQFQDFRQAIRVPVRSESGVSQLIKYYNHLSHLEKRFYSPGKSLGIYFHWYDSLTGVPYCLRTIYFEKGSILFNIGALYTQIACKQDRKTLDGVEAAIENFQKAAGAFQYLVDYFTQAPSMDMHPDTLRMLIKLMKTQAQECIYEKLVLNEQSLGILSHLKIAKMAAKVSQMYNICHEMTSADPVKAYVPYSWISMMLVKSQYYKAQAHCHVGLDLLDPDDTSNLCKLRELFTVLKLSENLPTIEKTASVLYLTPEKRKIQGKAHYRECILLLEDALNTHDLCKQLRKIDLFHGVLRKAYERALKKYESLEEEDDFSDYVKVPSIVPEPGFEVYCIAPHFAQNSVVDFFQALGPGHIFCASHLWTAPRVVHLTKDPKQGYGFSIRGDAPVRVNKVEPSTNAEKSGMKKGDLIVSVGEKDTKWSLHEELVQLVRSCGDSLTLKLVTPMDDDIPSVNDSPINRRASTGASLSLSHEKNDPANTNDSKNSKSKKRLSAPWLFIRKNSNKSLSKADKKTNGGEMPAR
ncbi:Rhophilin-1,Rhophilin-2-B,Rhophilin-2 [Acanthosepion pharaonis]|uniref:Rhophilin-1,Rhophilin-2-B,Rhophilin-2 n=1 Tax=Acanthosepion pharaonis TaxID=158019 RepID=A0A812AWP1_ACAPH|nr:Rhophilin-1,Rhophilin-2-B,Rhophilin-2 [Sepia pharaonis]